MKRKRKNIISLNDKRRKHVICNTIEEDWDIFIKNEYPKTQRYWRRAIRGWLYTIKK